MYVGLCIFIVNRKKKQTQYLMSWIPEFELSLEHPQRVFLNPLVNVHPVKNWTSHWLELEETNSSNGW